MKETFPLDVKGHLFSHEPITTVDVLRGLPHTGDLILGEASMSYRCAMCNAWRDLKIVGGTVEQPEPCPIPDGMTSVVDIVFPSGKIVVYDDLRQYFDTHVFEVEGYGSVLGDVRTTEAYAARGLAWGHVGNSCPDLFRTGEDTYVIANLEYADDGEGDAIVPDGWTELAGILTGTWAYSIADHDDYLSRGGVIGEGAPACLTVVEIPPGTYRFTHHTGEKGFDHYADGTVIFAHIERIKEK